MMTTEAPTYSVEFDGDLPIRSNTPEWLARRRTGLGASEAPAILGLSRYSTPRDVYLSKLADTITDEQTDRMRAGHLMEPIVRQLFAERHSDPESTRHRYIGRILDAPGLIRSAEHPILLASLDGVVQEDDGALSPLQIKNQSAYRRRAWDDADGGVPDEVRVQIIQEAIVFGADHGWALPIFDGWDMIEPIRVDADRDFVAWYVETAQTWWNAYVMARVEPPVTLHDDLDDVFAAESGKRIALSPEALLAVDAFKGLREARKATEASMDEVKLVVQNELGDATEGYDMSDEFHPRLAVTWRRGADTVRPVLDEETLLADHPEVADLLDAYRVETTVRKGARTFLPK